MPLYLPTMPPLEDSSSSGLELIRLLRDAVIQYQTNHRRSLPDASLIQQIVLLTF
jgi:hypothetical protein